jgi:hypothetical protein
MAPASPPGSARDCTTPRARPVDRILCGMYVLLRYKQQVGNNVCVEEGHSKGAFGSRLCLASHNADDARTWALDLLAQQLVCGVMPKLTALPCLRCAANAAGNQTRAKSAARKVRRNVAASGHELNVPLDSNTFV